MIWFAVVAAIACWWCGCATAPPPTAADLRLPKPANETERTYLGLSAGEEGFRLEDIRCEILVVDCFDMYCHYCQSGAAHVNELHRLAQERGLGERVKFVGIGVGDTPMEVGVYKDKFNVPFPAFPDRHAVIAKSLGPLKLPNLIILRHQPGGLRVVESFSGTLRDPAQVLTHIQAALANETALGQIDSGDGEPQTCGEKSTSCRNPALPRNRDSALAPGRP